MQLPGVKWEEGNVDCDLPNNALIGGLDSDGAEIVVGRALHEGVYQAAKIIKNKGRAYICKKIINSNILTVFK